MPGPSQPPPPQPHPQLGQTGSIVHHPFSLSSLSSLPKTYKVQKSDWKCLDTFLGWFFDLYAKPEKQYTLLSPHFVDDEMNSEQLLSKPTVARGECGMAWGRSCQTLSGVVA